MASKKNGVIGGAGEGTFPLKNSEKCQEREALSFSTRSWEVDKTRVRKTKKLNETAGLGGNQQ